MNLRNTLTALSYVNIKAIYDGFEGEIQKGSYGTDAVGRSQYVPEQPERVVFVTFNKKARCHSGFSVEPHRVQLKVNNQIIDREMNDAEFDQYKKDIEYFEKKEREKVQRELERAALLTRLGITEEEANLLIL